MDLYTAGLWYTEPDAFPLQARLPCNPHEALKTYRAQLRLALRDPGHFLGGLLDQPSLTACIPVGREAQLEVFCEVMVEHGAAWRGARPLPEAHPWWPCARHPTCPRQAQIQAWCPVCWDLISEELQEKLVRVYRPNQHHDGDCHAWMLLAFQTPRP